MFTNLCKGRTSQLPDGKHSLYGRADDSGGWLLRIRSSGPLDRLTQRELQVAERFARGVSHKGIAEELQLTPATARNHLRHLYEKLEIHDRDALVALLNRR
jgi:DNA-binding NarL/FixJ family response regulator